MSEERAPVRWKYKTDTVTVGENSVTVRELTAGERIAWAKMQREAKAAKDKGEPIDEFAAIRLVAKSGILPALTDEELEAMPADLYGSAANKILDLSGLVPEPEREKKDAALTN